MGLRACASMEGDEAAVGSPNFFQWLKPRCSLSSPSSRSSSGSSSSSSSTSTMASRHQLLALGEEGQAAGRGVVVAQQEASSVTCLPLLSRLGGERKGDDGHHEQCAVKEETTSGGGATGGLLAPSGVDLNIALPVGGSCSIDDEDAVMEEEKGGGEDEVDQEAAGGGEDESEWKRTHGGEAEEGMMMMTMDRQERDDDVAPSVEGSDTFVGVVVGEGGRGLPPPLAGCRYWIPTPAQILVGPVQFICHVCNKTFNRYNNMQVCYHVCHACTFVITDLRRDL
jgi:hypothetical protein